MGLVMVTDLTARALHEMRKRLWERAFGFRVPRGLVFKQRCGCDPACTVVEHLYLAEGAAEGLVFVPRRRRWRRAVSVGPLGWNRGERNGHAKLSAERVAMIRESAAAGATVGILALVYSVNESTIRRVLKGDTWKA